MNFSISQLSRKGGRDINEDRVGYCHMREADIFLLADGMGGHPEGEVAAELAVQAMAARFQQAARDGIEDVRGFLVSALMEAHHTILRYAQDKGMAETPRTTVVAALIEAGCLSWIHCGDSRLYLVRDGELLVRTRDHSYAEQRPNEIPMSKTGVPLNRHVLLTCLGSPADPVFDVAGPVALQQGDKVLLCSDGLWGSLDEQALVDGLWGQPVTQAVPELVERALAHAGESSDNVTVLALEWVRSDDFQATRDGITRGGVAEEVFASTVQADELDNMTHDLDDAEIDRSIAEINAAIQRAATRKK